MKADAAVARRFLWVGATLLAIGIALAAIGVKTMGSVVTLVGAAVLIAGVHTFGRAGPDHGEPGERSPSHPPSDSGRA